MNKEKLKEFGYIYLSSPYSDDLSYVRHKRFTAICAIAGELLGKGYVLHCPIAESHSIAIYSSKATDLTHKQWMMKDIEQLDRSDTLFVAMLPGWDESNGVLEEIAYAKKKGMDIYYINEHGDIQDGSDSK